MQTVYWFSELSKGSLAVAGGKGANLGEMFNSKFPIPEGFVVSSETYFEFVKRNGIDKLIAEECAKLDVEDTRKLNEVSDKIRNAITSAQVPNEMRADIIKAYNRLCGVSLFPNADQEVFVAVRSSATAEDLPEASFAGQQETYLNVKGSDALVNAVRKCWASLFGARAIYYRNEQHFDHNKVGLAAVVQRMVQSEKAGVMFSVDPVSMNEDLLVIEGAFGLGESVVSGSVTPDRYAVQKSTMTMTEKQVGRQETMIVKSGDGDKTLEVPEELKEKQKLSESEVLGLAKIGVAIEQHYGSPQDMEWAVEKGKLYIVQSRAITTLKKKGGSAVAGGKEGVKMEGSSSDLISPDKAKVLLQGLKASPGISIGPVRIVFDLKELYKVKQGDVLVTKMTTPDFVPAMKRACAIVTDEGGSTAHAAIVSRELGIPCIVGTQKATQVLKEDEVITVDALRGIVYEGKVDFGEKKKEAAGGAGSVVVANSPIITGTKVYVNLAEPERAEEVAAQNVDGVGLLRAEFMIAGFGKHPKKIIEEGKQEEFIETLSKGLRRVCAAFYPRPVVYRATDFKTNEYRNLEGGAEFEPHEENPMIGFRGCFRYVKEPEVFKMELQAIKRVRETYGMKNLWLMIPFVRRTGELKHAKELMNDAGLYQTKDFKLWIMVEVPSTVFIIDNFLDVGIDGISIGSNDLTQLILGVDRDNPIVAEDFDERNEAVKVALKRVIDHCNARGVTSSLCGQAPSTYPEFAEMLVELGTTSMSVNPDVIDLTRKIVASAEQKLLLKKAREGK